MQENINTFVLISTIEFANEHSYKNEKLPQAQKPLSKFEEDLSYVDLHLS